MKLLIILFILAIIEPKVIEKAISLSAFRRGFGWFYLSKMTLSPGVSTIDFTTIVQGNPISTLEEIQLSLVEDTEWDQELKEKCGRKPMRSYNHTMQNGGVPTHSHTQINIDQQHIYYFVLRDCKNRLTNNYTNMNVMVDIRLVVINNSSHLGEQEDNWIIFPLVLVSVIWIVMRLRKKNPMQEHQRDWAQITLLSGVITRTIALGFKGIGYLCYVLSGWNFIVFEIGYMSFHSVSETIIMTLLIFVAFGWTISYTKNQDFDIFIPLVCLMGFIKMIINVLGLLNEETHDKYHMYDSIPALITVVLRIFVYLLFLSGLVYSFKDFMKKSKKFTISFFLCGSVYILSLPLMIGFTVYFVSKIKQSQFVFLSAQLFQMVTNLMMTYMITSKKSLYHKVSVKNVSFLDSKDGKHF